MTFGDIFSEINLDSSIIDVIILTNLLFLASILGVPTLNIIWSFLHDRDIKDMSKIVTKQKDLNFDHRRLGTNCVSLCFTLFPAYLHNDPLCTSYKALLRMSSLFFQCLYQFLIFTPHTKKPQGRQLAAIFFGYENT